MLGDVRAIEATVERELTTSTTSQARVSDEGLASTPSSTASSAITSSRERSEHRPMLASDRPPRPGAATDRIAVSGAQSASSRVVEPSSEPQANVIGAARVSGALSAAPPRTLTSGGPATVAGPIVPWREVAAGSTAAAVALGHQSHDTAVASAGYFTRLGKRIASSF
jgi:hypothetical protein